MREPDGLQCELYAVHLYRVLWELHSLPSFFYYELLLIHTVQEKLKDSGIICWRLLVISTNGLVIWYDYLVGACYIRSIVIILVKITKLGYNIVNKFHHNTVSWDLPDINYTCSLSGAICTFGVVYKANPSQYSATDIICLIVVTCMNMSHLPDIYHNLQTPLFIGNLLELIVGLNKQQLFLHCIYSNEYLLWL